MPRPTGSIRRPRVPRRERPPTGPALRPHRAPDPVGGPGRPAPLAPRGIRNTGIDPPPDPGARCSLLASVPAERAIEVASGMEWSGMPAYGGSFWFHSSHCGPGSFPSSTARQGILCHPTAAESMSDDPSAPRPTRFAFSRRWPMNGDCGPTGWWARVMLPFLQRWSRISPPN